ncbi:MAG: tellurite resistance protein TerC [Actinomycetota bacterium]|nr:tellurite resistance protein TerC [Actinomycetota bacterium]
MSAPLWFQVTSLTILALLLLIDVALVVRRPREPSMREAATWVLFYVSLAVAFGGLLWIMAGSENGAAFLAGWITEYSLSVDNLFVFVLIMSRFSVPRRAQQTVLMVGIVLSLILRGGCILLGAAAIERYSWVYYLFGAFLIYTAVGLMRPEDKDGEFQENALVRRARRILPLAEDYDGVRIVIRTGARRLLSPIVIVFLAIGTTDLLFAVDSIPAIFGLSQDPFIVFTATLFALMGLRQLYFLLGGLLSRLVYLSYGLAVILGFIGVKLVLEALHTNELSFINSGEHVSWAPQVPIWASLAVIVGVLSLTAAASLLAERFAVRRAANAAPRPGVPNIPAVPGVLEASDRTGESGSAEASSASPAAGPPLR